MARYDLEYPKDAHNTVNRHDERASYALKTIHNLINTSPLVNISYTTPDSPFPLTLPMIGQMGSFDRPSADTGDPTDLYVHGYVSSRVMNTYRSNEGEKGLPVCVSVSHVDGLILALSAFNHDYNYRSAVLFGYAELVEDKDEKLYAMELITNSVVPDRYRHTRMPINNSELQSTSILRIRIASGSAKIRVGSAREQKQDIENQEVVDKVWTGVLPMYHTFGEPVPSDHNKVEVPAYIREFVDDYGKDNREYALKVIKQTQ